MGSKARPERFVVYIRSSHRASSIAPKPIRDIKFQSNSRARVHLKQLPTVKRVLYAGKRETIKMPDKPIPKASRSLLAYENPKFTNGPDGRPLRILSEYSEPLARFRRERIQDTIVFFGSARFHSRSAAEEHLSFWRSPAPRNPHPPKPQQERIRTRTRRRPDGPLLRRRPPSRLSARRLE